MSLIRRLADQVLPPRPRFVRQSGPENCAQTVLAMALGVSVDAITSHLGTSGTVTVNQVLVLLGRYGIVTRPVAASFARRHWPAFYESHGRKRLRAMGVTLPEGGDGVGHAYFIAGNVVYDPATGAKTPLGSGLSKLDWLILLPTEAQEIAVSTALSGHLRPGFA